MITTVATMHAHSLRPPKKFTAAATAVLFFFSSILAPALEASISAFAAEPAVQCVTEDIIPPQVGRITSSRDFPGARTVFLIQDLHCHPEVQKNISAIIGSIDKKYALERVYVEGASGEVNTSCLTQFPGAGLAAPVAQALLDAGRLTGGEYYSITANKPHLLRGLEDSRLHEENIVRLGTLLAQKNAWTASAGLLDEDLSLLKNRYLNRRNKKLNEIIAGYSSRRISARKYYSILQKYAELVNRRPRAFNATMAIRMDRYPNMAAYRELMALGERLNHARIKRQLGTFLGGLKATLPYREYNNLLQATDQFSDADKLVAALSTLAAERRISLMPRYPDLAVYFRYHERSRAINPVELIREEKQLVSELRIAFSRDVNEVEVSFLCDFQDVFKDYLFNRLSAADYGYFVSRFEKFKTLWAKHNYTNHLTDLEPAFPLLDAYYAVNSQRSAGFVERTLGDPAAPSVIVMVTGGFHTEDIQKLLEDRRISYRTVTPRIHADTAAAAITYESIIREQAALFSRNALSYRPFTQMATEVLPTDDGYILRFQTGEHVRISSKDKKVTLQAMSENEIVTIDARSEFIDAAAYAADRAGAMARSHLGLFEAMLRGPDIVPFTGMLYFLARKGWLQGAGLSMDIEQCSGEDTVAVLEFLAEAIHKKAANLNDLACLPESAQGSVLDHVKAMQGVDRSTPAYILAVDVLYKLLIRINNIQADGQNAGVADLSLSPIPVASLESGAVGENPWLSLREVITIPLTEEKRAELRQIEDFARQVIQRAETAAGAAAILVHHNKKTLLQRLQNYLSIVGFLNNPPPNLEAEYKFKETDKKVQEWVQAGERITVDKLIGVNTMLRDSKDRESRGLRQRGPVYNKFFGRYLDGEYVEEALQDAIRWYEIEKARISNNDANKLTVIELAVKMHRMFISIHPFADGNDRTAELLMTWILLEHGLPAVFVDKVKHNFAVLSQINVRGTQRPILRVFADVAPSFLMRFSLTDEESNEIKGYYVEKSNNLIDALAGGMKASVEELDQLMEPDEPGPAIETGDTVPSAVVMPEISFDNWSNRLLVSPASGNEEIDYFLLRLFNQFSDHLVRAGYDVVDVYWDIKQKMVSDVALGNDPLVTAYQFVLEKYLPIEVLRQQFIDKASHAAGQSADQAAAFEQRVRESLARDLHKLESFVAEAREIGRVRDVDGNLIYKRILGTGSNGYVLLVWDTKDQDNPWKVFKVPYFRSVKELRNEIKVFRALEGVPHLAKIFKVYGEETDRPRMLMELIEGDSLKKYVVGLMDGELHEITDQMETALLEYADAVAARGYSIYSPSEDFYENNIMVGLDGKITVIDIGRYSYYPKLALGTHMSRNRQGVDRVLNEMGHVYRTLSAEMPGGSETQSIARGQGGRSSGSSVLSGDVDMYSSLGLHLDKFLKYAGIGMGDTAAAIASAIISLFSGEGDKDIVTAADTSDAAVEALAHAEDLAVRMRRHPQITPAFRVEVKVSRSNSVFVKHGNRVCGMPAFLQAEPGVVTLYIHQEFINALYAEHRQMTQTLKQSLPRGDLIEQFVGEEIDELVEILYQTKTNHIKPAQAYLQHHRRKAGQPPAHHPLLTALAQKTGIAALDLTDIYEPTVLRPEVVIPGDGTSFTLSPSSFKPQYFIDELSQSLLQEWTEVNGSVQIQFVNAAEVPENGFIVRKHALKLIDGTIFTVPNKARRKRKVTTSISIDKNITFVKMLRLISALYEDMLAGKDAVLLKKKQNDLDRIAKNFIYAADYLDEIKTLWVPALLSHGAQSNEMKEITDYLDLLISGFRAMTKGYTLTLEDSKQKQSAIAESWLGIDEGWRASIMRMPAEKRTGIIVKMLVMNRDRWAKSIAGEIAKPVRELDAAIMELGGRQLDAISSPADITKSIMDDIYTEYNAYVDGKTLTEQQLTEIFIIIVETALYRYYVQSLDSTLGASNKDLRSIASGLGVAPRLLASFNEMSASEITETLHMDCLRASYLCGRILRSRGIPVFWVDVQETAGRHQDMHVAILAGLPNNNYRLVDSVYHVGGRIPTQYLAPGEVEESLSESPAFRKELDVHAKDSHHVIRISDFDAGALSALHSNLGLNLYQLKKDPDARAHFRIALEYNPQKVNSWDGIAVDLLLRHRFTDAIIAFQNILRLSPKRRDVLLRIELTKAYMESMLRIDAIIAGSSTGNTVQSEAISSLGEPSVPTQASNLQPYNEILLYPDGKFRGVAPNSGNEDIDHFLFKLFNDQSVIEDRTVNEIETAYQEIKQRIVHNYGLSASGQDLFDGIENMLRALFPRENASFVHDLFNRVKNAQSTFKATEIDPVNLRHVRILEAGDFGVILLVEDKRVAGTDKRRVLKIPRASPLSTQVINKEISNLRDMQGTQGLVKIYEIYENPAILMEYVDGDTLDAYYNKHHTVPDTIREALHEYARNVAASGYGISDIHGANVIIQNDGAVKIIDIAIYDKHRRAHGDELAAYNINKIDEMLRRFTQTKGPEAILPANQPESGGPVSPMTLESSRVVENILRGIGVWSRLPRRIRAGVQAGVRVFDERVSAPLLELPRLVSFLVLSLTNPGKYATAVDAFFKEHGYTRETHDYNYFKKGMEEILQNGTIYNVFNFPVPSPGTIAQLVARHSRYNRDARKDRPANPPVMLLPGKGVQPAAAVKSADARDGRTPAATTPEISLIPFKDTKYIEVAPLTGHEEIDHFLYRLFKSSLVPYALNHLSGFNVEDAYYTVRKNMLANIENGRNPFVGMDGLITEIFNPNDSMQSALVSARKTAALYRDQLLKQGSVSVKPAQDDEFDLTLPFFTKTDESGILAQKIKDGVDVAEIDEFIANNIVPVSELDAILRDVSEAQNTRYSNYIKVEEIDKNLRYERILSSGKYGIIIVVEDRRDKTKKILKIPNIHPSSEQKMRAEIAILKDLNGTPGLVPIIEYYNGPAILMEYVRGASLFEHIAVHKQGIPESLISEMLDFGIAVAKKGYFLKDLHPGNIMINEQGRAIFIDVGEYQKTDDVPAVVEKINTDRIRASYSSAIAPGADAAAAAILPENAGPHLLFVGRLRRFMPLRWAKVIGLAIVHAKEYALLKPLTDEMASVEAEHHAAVYDAKHGAKEAARRSAILAMGETGRQACCNFPWPGVSRAARFIASGIAHITYDLTASLPMAFIVSEKGTGLEDARAKAVKNGLVPVIVRPLPAKLAGKAPRSAGIKNVWARMEDDTLVMYIKASDTDTFRRMAADVVNTVRGYAHVRGSAVPVRILSDEVHRTLDGEKVVVYDDIGAKLPLDKWQDVQVLTESSQWGPWEAMANDYHADTVARAPEMGLEVAWSEDLMMSLLQRDRRLNQSLFFTVGTREDLQRLTKQGDTGMTPVQQLQNRGAKVYAIYNGTSKLFAQGLIDDTKHGFDGVVCTAPTLKARAVSEAAHDEKVVAGADAERALVNLNLANKPSEKDLAAVKPGSIVRVHLGKNTTGESIIALKALPSSAIIVFNRDEVMLSRNMKDPTELSAADVILLNLLRFTPRSREELVEHQRKVADELAIGTFEPYGAVAEAEREFSKLVSGNFSAVTKNKMFIEAVRLHSRRVDDKGLRKEFLNAVAARLRALQVLAEAGKLRGVVDQRLERILAEVIPLAHDAQPDVEVLKIVAKQAAPGSSIPAERFEILLFSEITALRRKAHADPQAARTVIELIKLYAQERNQISISAKDTVLTGTAAAKAILEAA